MGNSAPATFPSRPRPRRSRTVAVAFRGWFNLARRALRALVVTVSPRLLNATPEVNAVDAAGPVHVVGIPENASVIQEEAGGNNQSAQWSNVQPPIPENAPFAAPVQEVSHPMTYSTLPHYGARSSLPGQLESEGESINSVTGAHPAQHVRPLLGRNKWWRMCDQLPMRDNEHLAFLVKASESSANAVLVLSFGGFTAAYFSKQDLGVMAKSVHETSVGKICFISVAFIMYGHAVWVSSMAKHCRSGLGTLPVQVIVLFSYLVLLGAFSAHCLTGATIWKIAPGVVILIAIMLVTWARTFSRPRSLRNFVIRWGYFGTDPAAAQTIEDDIIARECNDRSSSARTAFVAQLALEEKAAKAKVRADETSKVQAKAKQNASAARKRAQEALSSLRQIALLVNDDDDAGSGQWLQEVENAAINAHVRAQKAADVATERFLEAVVDAHKKMEEFRAAAKEAKEADTIAQAKLERAEAAKKFWELSG